MIALATGVYKRFGNLVRAMMWSDLCQCNGNPYTCIGASLADNVWSGFGCIAGAEFIANKWTIDANCTSPGVFYWNFQALVETGTLQMYDVASHALLATCTGASVPPGGGHTYTVWDGGPVALTAGQSIYVGICKANVSCYPGNVSSPTNTLHPFAHQTGTAFASGFVYPTSSPVGANVGCQPELCGTGSPTIPPDPTPPTPPAGFPTYPGPAACASFNDVCAAIGALGTQVRTIADQVRLLRNYQVPFGLVNGTDHAGLTGSGTFPIGGVLGFRIRVTGGSGSPVLPGNPPYVMNQGWVSVDDASGMYTEKRVTQTSFLWLPPNAQLATSFNWALQAGITVDVLELLAEP